MSTTPERESYQGPPAVTRKRFAAWIQKVGGSREAARLLDVSRSYIDMIKNGQRSPGLRTAEKIERLTDGAITMQSWIPPRAPTR